MKAKGVVKTKVKKVAKVIDPTKFHHNNWRGNDLFQLVKALPKPALAGFEYDPRRHSGGAAGGAWKCAAARCTALCRVVPRTRLTTSLSDLLCCCILRSLQAQGHLAAQEWLRSEVLSPAVDAIPRAVLLDDRQTQSEAQNGQRA